MAKPYEFISERFDYSDPISLKPDGGKRSPSAWAPFAGGKRMCFAPNFAQQEIALVTTYLTQFFDLKFVNPKFNKQQRLTSLTLTPNCHLLNPRRIKYISRFVEKNKLSVNAVNIGIEL